MKSSKFEDTIEGLIRIVKKLRSPDGCEWDKKQTSESLVPYFLEEVHEVIEAIDNNDSNSLKEELGDLLLHIVFQISIAEQKKDFVITFYHQLVRSAGTFPKISTFKIYFPIGPRIPWKSLINHTSIFLPLVKKCGKFTTFLPHP